MTGSNTPVKCDSYTQDRVLYLLRVGRRWAVYAEPNAYTR